MLEPSPIYMVYWFLLDAHICNPPCPSLLLCMSQRFLPQSCSRVDYKQLEHSWTQTVRHKKMGPPARLIGLLPQGKALLHSYSRCI